MRRWPGLLMLMMAVVLVGAACSKSSTPNNSTTTAGGGGKTTTAGGGGQTTIDGEKANDHGSADLSGMSAFTVGTVNFAFDPTTLKGTPGEKVTLTIANASATDHNFTVESQKINLDVDAGQTKTVTVTFPKSGSVEFHCEYHQGSGMVGQLETS
jgi:plastocyanin